MSAVVIRGDAAHLPLPDGSVDLIVTSPPYFGLRSYSDGGEHYDGQIGSEETPAEYIAALLRCTREWMRALKPSGSIFVNLGDKYSQSASQWQGSRRGHCGSLAGTKADTAAQFGLGAWSDAPEMGRPKSLLGMPWRYALACMDDLGLILRAEVIWDKPNGLPESVTDRVRRSHEQIFHFTKQPRYFAAVDEIRERPVRPHGRTWEQRKAMGEVGRQGEQTGFMDGPGFAPNPLGKLPGSVWEIPSAPLVVPAHLGIDHFAAYPPELCRRIILGWSPSGICTECREGRRPVAGHTPEWAAFREHHGMGSWHDHNDRLGIGNRTTRGPSNGAVAAFGPKHMITGYACACPDASAALRPAVVLDPFGGTGTTALVADVLGRTGITVDRSADYCRLARWRTSDPGERARALGVPKPPPVLEGQGSLFDGLEDTA